MMSRGDIEECPNQTTATEAVKLAEIKRGLVQGSVETSKEAQCTV